MVQFIITVVVPFFVCILSTRFFSITMYYYQRSLCCSSTPPPTLCKGNWRTLVFFIGFMWKADHPTTQLSIIAKISTSLYIVLGRLRGGISPRGWYLIEALDSFASITLNLWTRKSNVCPCSFFRTTKIKRSDSLYSYWNRCQILKLKSWH